MALDFQCNVANGNHQLIYKYLTEKYKHLITDFHHILTTHLNNHSKTLNNKNFKKIHYYLTSFNITCNIQKCQQFQRNQRDRDQQQSTTANNDDFVFEYYIDLLDNIHVYFLHSYDTGYRIDMQLLNDDMFHDQWDEHNIGFIDYDLNDIKQIYIDNSFKKLKQLLKSKRKLMEDDYEKKESTDNRVTRLKKIVR
eukprot:166237_1